MAYSYDEILERMENKYYELTGHEAAKCGDIGIRLKLLAGEIYSMGSNIDWLKRQMFFTTATGEQLDFYAAQRGIERIRGSKARGDIIIALDVPVDYEMVVPAGTVCTTSDGSLNFLIDKDLTITAGSLEAIASAVAEHTGKIYNVKRRAITTVVTYFSVGVNIDNASAFTGGTDDETDEELRARIAATYQNIPNGANAAYYQAAAERIEGVQSANVVEEGDDNRVLNIYIAGRGKTCSSQTKTTVQQVMEKAKCAGHTVTITNASLVSYDMNLSISVKDGYDSAAVKEKVETAVRNYFYSLRVGQSALLAEVGSEVLHVEGVENYAFNSMNDKKPKVSQLVVLRNLTIGEL